MLSMELETFTTYYRAIDILEAQKRLVDMTTADWPQMKKKDRESFFKKIKKVAYPNTFKKKLKLTAENLRELIDGNR